MNKISYWSEDVTLFVKYQEGVNDRIYWFKYVFGNCFYGSGKEKYKQGDWIGEKDVQLVRLPIDRMYKTPAEWLALSTDEKRYYWTVLPTSIVAKGKNTDRIKGGIGDEGLSDVDFLDKYKYSGVFVISSVKENILKNLKIKHIKATGV